MKKIFALTLLVSGWLCSGASSCASPVIATISPIDANKYEAPFKFNCDGKQMLAFGTATCQYKEGEQMTIQIKHPDDVGEIQVRSCRHSRALDIDRSSTWQTVQWTQYTLEDSCPITFTVTTKNAGIQMGRIFPYVYNDKFPKMAGQGSFYCWESEKNEQFSGVSSCQVPTGIKVDGYLDINSAKSGKYLIVSDCFADKLTGSFAAGQSPIKWTMTSSSSQYCPVSAAVKYDDGTIEEYETYLEFFSEKYAALPAPIMQQSGSDSAACAPQDFEFFDLNDHTKKNGLFSGHCIQDGWLDGGVAIGIAWDPVGRSSFALLQCKGDQCPTSSSQLQIKTLHSR